MGRIVAVCGQKGGTGKSTVSTCLASELLARGMRVLLVDADPQRSASGWVAIAKEQQRAQPTLLVMGAQMHSADQLGKVAAAYDVTIIDCPPQLGEVQASALMVADLALLPCGPSAFEAWSLDNSLRLVKDAQQVRRRLRAAVVINKRKGETRIGKDAREVLTGGGATVLAAELRDRVAYQEAPASGLGVSQYDPSSDAADEVRSLTDEVLHILRGRNEQPKETRNLRPQPRRRR